MKRILAIMAIVALSFTLPSCKGKSDADLKTAVETALQANPTLSGVIVDVKDGVATLSGELSNASAQAAAAEAVKAVKGIKSVQNNTTIVSMEPPPVSSSPVTISPDNTLSKAVEDAIKDHPTVSATIENGAVKLSGEIAKSDLKVLMQKVQATKPKKVDSQGLTVK